MGFLSWSRSNTVAFSFLSQLHYRKTNTICKKNKDAWYYFFLFFNHFWFPLPVRFLLLEIFTVGKILQLSADHHTGWLLCKLWEHHFSVPDLVSSPSLTATIDDLIHTYSYTVIKCLLSSKHPSTLIKLYSLPLSNKSDLSNRYSL